MCKVSMLRDALREELDAANTYDRLIEAIPEYRNVLEEIKKDEINHQGRLLDLIMQADANQVEPFNKGLKQEE